MTPRTHQMSERGYKIFLKAHLVATGVNAPPQLRVLSPHIASTWRGLGVMLLVLHVLVLAVSASLGQRVGVVTEY